MILSHEIPQGSKLYFGESARIKRSLENLVSAILSKNGYEEIITPTFSYLQHQRNMHSREVVRTSNQHNHQIILRNDSTIDAMRLLEPHLRENIIGKRWFYIQPIFIYPTTEIHQIGVENLENCNIAHFLTMSLEILNANLTEQKIQQNMSRIFLQLTNAKIPLICAKTFGIPLEAFAKIDVNTIESANPVTSALLHIQDLDSLENAMRSLKSMPDALKEALEELRSLASFIRSKHANCVISPFYYVPMSYYTGLFFRFFTGNTTLISGGEYKILEQNACGFGIYTDEFIQYLLRSKSE